MSCATTRIPLGQAESIAAAFIEQFGRGLPAPGLEVVGSIRRRKPEVGDIEILAPAPIIGEGDLLHAALLIQTDFPQAGTLFGRDNAKPFEHIKGLWTGFLFAQLFDRRHNVKIDIFRYYRRPTNYGLKKLIWTGSAEFSQRVVTALHPGGFRSQDGYVRDSNNQLIETPDEASVFALAGMRYVEPEERS